MADSVNGKGFFFMKHSGKFDLFLLVIALCILCFSVGFYMGKSRRTFPITQTVVETERIGES